MRTEILKGHEYPSDKLIVLHMDMEISPNVVVSRTKSQIISLKPN